MTRGYTRRDIGRRLSWGDVKDFIGWLPPTGDSALWRSRKPQSWWVTPEIRFLTNQIYVLELANWQRGGGKKSRGKKPQPIKLPEDKDISVKSPDELADRRKQQSAHLKHRRAELRKQKERR